MSCVHLPIIVMPSPDMSAEPDVACNDVAIIDHLFIKFGRAPWWLISSVFHVLLLVFVSLVGMAVYHVEREIVLVIDLIHPNPKFPEQPRACVNLHEAEQLVPPDKPIVELVDVLVADELLIEAPNDRMDESVPDLRDPEGVHGLSDVSLSASYDFNAALGLNGGGAGAFGRPFGSGARRRAAAQYRSSETQHHAEAAMSWLARHQEPDGRWDCEKYGGQKADVAVTGLALLTFLGAGHTESKGVHQDTVQRAVAWLRGIQQADGQVCIEGEIQGVGYHHAIAGLALVEAAGMEPDAEATNLAAQKAVDYSVRVHQVAVGRVLDGWRYAAQSPRADISVSGWYIMQLKSAKVAGLAVDPMGLDGAVRFLDRVEQKGAGSDPSSGHRYGYTSAQGVTPRRTAIGCLARQFLGWDDKSLSGGVDWFVRHGGLPKWEGNGGEVDMYYWYYGTLAVFNQKKVNAPLWESWNEAMKTALLANQREGGDEHGSWDPVGAYCDHWGRVGQTALAGMCLQVYYRYNLMQR